MIRRPMNVQWDQRVTICVDERRIRYCAAQLKRVTSVSTKAHAHADRVLRGLDEGYKISYRHRYALERLYRMHVLYQQTDPGWITKQ